MTAPRFEPLFSKVGDMALKRRARMLLEELRPTDSDVILDCGCGDGFYLHIISSLSQCRLIGLDSDPRALESARRNLRGRSVELVEGDVNNLPFEDNSVDRAILAEVLEHLEDDRGALQEVRRVLRPTGRVFITVPNGNYPFLWDPVNKILERLTSRHVKQGFWAGIWNQHRRLYTREEIDSLVVQAGFEVERVLELTHYCLPFNHHFLNIGARLLAANHLSDDLAHSVSKFAPPSSRRKRIATAAFWLVNRLDGRNDSLTTGRTAVSIFLKARKRD